MSAQLLSLDEQLVAIMVKATKDGLKMTGLEPHPIGLSKLLHSNGNVSSIIGFVGPVSGSLIINTSDICACFLASRMLGETLDELDNQTLDSLCEIANIICGQAKASLSTTEYRFDRMSIPSVIVGNNYSISHYRGMASVSVEFELPEMPIKPGERGTFTVNISMMKV